MKDYIKPEIDIISFDLYGAIVTDVTSTPTVISDEDPLGDA